MSDRNKQRKPTEGFAIRLEEDTELSGAMLIAEDDDGHYEPVGQPISIREAREIAASDMRGRMRHLERDEDAGICPSLYRVWARGIGGDYKVAIDISI